ncbi:MAG: pentapeptide repeat-containing protein [Emticicia sp.]|nr:pentapeptide repeat-containing protein [Emticicia sp.]
MKKLLILLFFTLIGTKVLAQKEISAKTIFDAIDKGQSADYQDAIIIGNLDLTELSNKKRIKNKGNYEEYKSYVEVPISFKNCTFKGDVIAYKNLEEEKNRKLGNGNVKWSIGDGITYSTDFEKAVVFENCSFAGKTEFKYSDFAEKASFGGAKFSKDANFKYADFKREVIFAKSDFDEYANFKYTSFKQDADFFDVRFKNYADFKYADFGERVTFKNTAFSNQADFKYAEFSDDANFDNTKFKAGFDMKYSNGKKYLNQ